jgi:hypothetical protein
MSREAGLLANINSLALFSLEAARNFGIVK